MPITPTYPGVYVEEIPSGVRTITGVATSIAAFVGRAKKGPVDEPMTINSYGDYERYYGGLWGKSTMSYAVRDFFLNGGGQAVIVRLINLASGVTGKSELRLPTGGTDPNDELELEAVSPGTWGDKLSAKVDHETKDKDDHDLFNLTITEDDGAIEKFPNVSIDSTDARYLPNVLAQESQLVRVTKVSDAYVMPNVRPGAYTSTPLSPPISPPMSPVADTTSGGGDDGMALADAEFFGTGMEGNKQGLYALEKADLFNILCIPPYTTQSLGGNAPDPLTTDDDDIHPTDVTKSLIGNAITYCKKRRAIFLIDPKSTWKTKTTVKTDVTATGTTSFPGLSADRSYAALFFPRLKQKNMLRDNQVEEFAPCGAVAGVFARTDAQRGVWKAPAGQEAGLVGVPELSVPLTDAENGELNQLGVNCLRAFPVYGRLVWGSRTCDGADRLASEWKYISVRRTALYIEESLYRGTQWVVFEPNDEPLWAQIRLNVGAFMHNLFRQGAFQGTAPKEAYLVKCDKETTNQTDINNGIVNIIVGFAPLKPAEFVMLKIQQLTGEIET